MNRNNEHNGQPPSQAAPLSDPRIRNCSTSSAIDQQEGTCRDYVWGICNKGSQCKYRHVLNPETMKTILKFCHDFQNRSGCTRQGCTYLHTTNEEENLFLTQGVIPKVLRDRYATSNTPYYNECVNQPPPPPPPLPLPIPTVLQAAVTQQPPPLPASMPTLLAPPPPPPPPTISAAPTLVTPPVFTGARQVNNSSLMVFPTAPDQIPTVKFDASKPPPPLPSVVRNGTIKRSAEPLEVEPNKRRKIDVGRSVCEACMLRELRIEVFRKEIERLECEKECQTFFLNSKSKAFANGKLLLKSAVGPDLFHILEAYIEGPSPSTNLHNQLFNIARNIVEGSRNNAVAEMLLNVTSSSPKPSSNPPSHLAGPSRIQITSSSHKPSSNPPSHLAGPSRIQSTIDPPKKTYAQKRQSGPQPLVAVQARNRPILNTQSIPTAPAQNVAHQPNLAYGQTVSSFQNAVQTPTMLHPPPTHQTPMRGMHPQPMPNYEFKGAPYPTAAPPPPRPYYPMAYADASNNAAAGYGHIRGVSGTPAVTTSAAATPSQYGYMQRYPHHP